MALATLDDLKTHLNIPANLTKDDAELQDVLDAASEVVVSMVGDFGSASVVEQLPVHSGTVLLERIPVGTVTVTGPTGKAVVGYTVRSAARLLTGVWGCGTVTVSYTAGGEPSASVKLATLIIAAQLWQTQRVPGRGQDPVPAGFAIPHRAAELLATVTSHRPVLA